MNPVIIWVVIAIVLIALSVYFMRNARRPTTGIVRIEVEPPREEHFQVRSLPAETRDHYATAWQTMQTRVEEEPEATVRDSDRLLQAALRDCGYPTGDFGKMPAAVLGEHRAVLENYLIAHRVSVKAETGFISDEEVRRAMAALRAAFEGLLTS